MDRNKAKPCFNSYADPVNELFPLDANGHQFNPPTNNYMGYIIPSCMSEFTNGQADKMKKTIKMHGGLALMKVQNPVAPVNWIDDLQISAGTTTWSQNRHVFGTITIPTGATLEIIGTAADNVVISFVGKDSGIVVEEGGRLLTEYAVLNNSCLEGDYWLGIRVEGDSNEDHPIDFITNGSTNHGVVTIENSQMENSHDGIHAIGGIVATLGQNRFINNRIGVSLTYQFGLQASYIQNATFFVDRPVPHPLFTQYRQVVGYQCNNLVVSGNTFIDSSGVDNTKAILVMNTPAFIGTQGSPNNFKNFDSGVEVHNFFVTLPTLIQGNTFTNVQHGIVLNTTAMPTVDDNIFNIPNGTVTSDAYGLLTYFSDGITVENNEFSTSYSNETKGAVFIQNEALNLVNANGWVSNNDFNGPFTAGTEFERNNEGLVLQCNTYTGSSIDWYLANTSYYSDRLRQQGTCNSDIAGVPGDKYGFWGEWSVGTNVVNNIINDSDDDFFRIEYDPVDYVLAQANPVDVKQSSCDENDSNGESGCTKVGLPDVLIDKPIDPIITDIESSLANNDLHEANTKLEAVNEVWADKLLVGNYWYLQDLTNATQKLQQIPTTTITNIAFVDVYTIVLNTPIGQKPTSTEEQTIRNYAVHSDVAITAMAESVLAYYYDELFVRYSTPIPTSHTAKRAVRDLQDFFQILPNPSSNYVKIVLKEDLINSKINKKVVLIDMTGQVKLEINIQKSSTQLDIRNLSAGIYLVAIKENNAVKYIEKLMITK